MKFQRIMIYCSTRRDKTMKREQQISVAQLTNQASSHGSNTCNDDTILENLNLKGMSYPVSK